MPNLNHFRDFTYVVGIDIAKSVFQVHSCNTQTGEIQNVPIKRAKLLEHFVNRGKCLIGMEACGSSQYWLENSRNSGTPFGSWIPSGSSRRPTQQERPS